VQVGKRKNRLSSGKKKKAMRDPSGEKGGTALVDNPKTAEVKCNRATQETGSGYLRNPVLEKKDEKKLGKGELK